VISITRLQKFALKIINETCSGNHFNEPECLKADNHKSISTSEICTDKWHAHIIIDLHVQ